MALTRDFKETVAARVQSDPAFAQALLDEAITLFIDGEPDTRATLGKIHTVKSLINRQYELKHSIPNRCWMSSPSSSSTPPWSTKCACARALSPAIAT